MGKVLQVGVSDPQLSLPPKPPERPVAKAIGTVIVAGVGLFAVIGGFSEASPVARLAITSLGVTILVLFATMTSAARRRVGRVRVRAGGGALVFTPPAVIPALLLLAAAGMVIVAIAAIAGLVTGHESGLPGTGRGTALRTRFGGASGMGLLGLWAIFDATGKLWPPRGLILSHSGLAWRRYLSRTEVTWEEIADVGLTYDRDQLCVVVCSPLGGCDTLYTLTTGSDPRVVAELIVFLRNHPEKRYVLDHPHRALSALGPVSSDSR